MAAADDPDGIMGAGAVMMWQPEVCHKGMKVGIDGGCVNMEMFWRLGKAPDETLLSGLLIQHQSIKAPGS